MNQYFQKNQTITYYILTIMVSGIMVARTNSFYSQDTTVTSIVALIFLFSFILPFHGSMERHLVDKKPLLDQAKFQLIYEISIYVLIGIILFLLEVFFNKQSYLLASKLFSTVLIVGYFASIDSALKREHDCFLKLNRHQSNIKNTIPVSRRISSSELPCVDRPRRPIRRAADAKRRTPRQ